MRRIGALESEQVDCLLTVLPEHVQPGVDDEAAGTPRGGRTEAHPGDVVAVQAHLVREPFAVEPPARFHRPYRAARDVQHATCSGSSVASIAIVS